ncbi:MAG TPA: hypothetical protein VN903_21925 [Polyangia bacterium]|jgi:hypothetical protein|nr:hypothetical protein [Polyangia bacterium]
MALSGGRNITVGGHPLRWVEASSYDSKQRKYELRLIVQSASGKGMRLVVRLPWGGPEHFMNKPVSRPLLPAWIARCVKAAYKRGFAPPLSKGPLIVTLATLLPDDPWPPTSREMKRAARASTP